MNRAMGFGILSGTMTGTMLASAALTPTPASAHGPVQQGAYGQVNVNYNPGIDQHIEISSFDYTCGDGVAVGFQLKSTAGGIASFMPSDCGFISEPYARVWGTFRKCLSLNHGPLACNDADWAAI